jgi:hypothetical protein
MYNLPFALLAFEMWDDFARRASWSETVIASGAEIATFSANEYGIWSHSEDAARSYATYFRLRDRR